MKMRPGSSGKQPQVNPSQSPVVVIADDGMNLRVIVVHLPTDTIVGSEFVHDDRSWIITADRPGSKVFFASPCNA
ncbi:MAG: hypothetical protein GY906_10955 [bacterium]|nr:hypothetical protein [bacterium]